MKYNKFIILKYIFFLAVLTQGTLFALPIDWQGDTKDIVPEEMEMALSTDQKSYFPGEPIFLVIALCNRGDRVLRLGVTKPWICDYEITVLDAKHERPTIPKERLKSEADIVVPRHNLMLVPMTRWLKRFREYGSKSFEIEPKGKEFFFFPLHLAFDMTSPEGVYTVKVKYKPCNFAVPSFTLEGTTTVKIKSKYSYKMSSVDMTAEYMTRMFGRRKATHFLCSEAEALLASLEQKKEGELEDSAAYRRLILLLRTVMIAAGRSAPYEKIESGLYDAEKHFRPDEIREMLGQIRKSIRYMEGVEEEEKEDEDDDEYE